MAQLYKALVVDKGPSGEISLRIKDRLVDDLTAGSIRIDAEYSALNYKDALACSGNPGVAQRFPLVPGIDLVGTVADSRDDRFRKGDRVQIAHPDFGTRVDGGYSLVVTVPGDWAMPIPQELTTLEAVGLGTAGFTAAQCVKALVDSGLHPTDGEVVVTGATGGVGIFAVMLLAKLGYKVVASTGKMDRRSALEQLGAERVIHRDELVDKSSRPLLSAKWAGGVDTVGGETLSTILRSTQPHRSVTACGLVGGTQLPITVLPFILRGISLVGIDSALVGPEVRQEVWGLLAHQWRLSKINELLKIVELTQLESEIAQILSGKVFGRVIVQLRQA